MGDLRHSFDPVFFTQEDKEQLTARLHQAAEQEDNMKDSTKRAIRHTSHRLIIGVAVAAALTTGAPGRRRGGRPDGLLRGPHPRGTEHPGGGHLPVKPQRDPQWLVVPIYRLHRGRQYRLPVGGAGGSRGHRLKLSRRTAPSMRKTSGSLCPRGATAGTVGGSRRIRTPIPLTTASSLPAEADEPVPVPCGGKPSTSPWGPSPTCGGPTQAPTRRCSTGDSETHPGHPGPHVDLRGCEAGLSRPDYPSRALRRLTPNVRSPIWTALPPSPRWRSPP